MPPRTVTAWLGLGANIGDKRAALVRATDLIASLPRTRVTARSRHWCTPPWGKTDQDWFVNAAVAVETSLTPTELLDACLGVEKRMGRERLEKWGPRLIDIDIIAYADAAISGDRLTLPHRHALERAFVLAPLAEIAPDLALSGRPIREALARLDQKGLAPLPDPEDPAAEPEFNRTFTGKPGELVRLSPLVRRMVAGNTGPFTFTGTCTYVVGEGEVAVIDPGPADPVHVKALASALKGETVSHIVITHTHRDHSPGAVLLKALTGAKIIGCAPHRSYRDLHAGEAGTESGGDRDYKPEHVLEDGEVFEGKGFTLEAVHTPGHTANHLAFALREENALFAGDHVMAWSTTVVAPPDGSMHDFMLSLDRLKGRDEAIYWPGHGGPVNEPKRFVRALIYHRRMREAAILNRIKQGDESIEAMVEAIYAGLDPRLKGGAARSVFAHLEDMAERGLIASDGPPTMTARYRSR